MTPSSSIVISGCGLITPLGLSRAATWKAVREGKCGLRELTALEQPLPEGSTGGQAPDLPADFARDQPREVRYLRFALTEALRDAKIEPLVTYPAQCCGIMLGTTLHGMRAAGVFLRSGDHHALSHFLAGATLHDSSADVRFTSFSATNCSACSSSLGSIALGISLLQSGQLDLVIAGGYDTISEYVYAGFNSLRLVAPGPLRPFTRDRRGMKLAEGYGLVVLERADDAIARGVHPLATILGYGESADAHHLTQPHPQGQGAARAINGALKSAGLTPAEIDLVAAHATGTPDNDAGEYAALSRVFGDNLPRVPVVAFKSHLGHTLGGAGAVELILSAMCLNEQMVPGCANVNADDLEFPGLRVATGPAQATNIRATLNTSLGFGGANTCVVLGPAPTQSPQSPSARSGSAGRSSENAETTRIESSASAKVDPAKHTLHPHARDVFITGIGVVLPGLIGNDAFIAALNSQLVHATRDSGPIPESDYIHLLNARRVRRMSDYVKLSLAATMLACKNAGIEDIPSFAESCSAILGSMHGSANYSEAYYQQIVREGIPAANPMLFAEGVPNAAAAHLSLMLSLKGPCQTIIGTRTAGLDALHLAATRISNGEWQRAIISAGEEYSPPVVSFYQKFGLGATECPSQPFDRAERGFVTGCGAITLVLESAESMGSRGARAHGRIMASSGPFIARPPHASPARRALAGLSKYDRTFVSANGTWLDRLETLLLGYRALDRVTSLTGSLRELYSVTPLAGIAAALLTRRFPTPRDMAPVTSLNSFAVLCTDYTGLASAAALAL